MLGGWRGCEKRRRDVEAVFGGSEEKEGGRIRV